MLGIKGKIKDIMVNNYLEQLLSKKICNSLYFYLSANFYELRKY